MIFPILHFQHEREIETLGVTSYSVILEIYFEMYVIHVSFRDMHDAATNMYVV